MTEKMPKTPRELSFYLARPLACDCGREHYASLKAVSVRKDALEDLPGYVRQMGFHRPYLVCDRITYDIAGKRCLALLEQAGIAAEARVITHPGFDEATVGELLIHMPLDCDLMVAVGTGAINDMTRFFSHRMGRPFFTVATAAPMDGFASSIAAINVESLKTTFDAQPPTAIIGDTEILKNAPYPMIAAGLGDLMGKSTCLCDWKLSRLINDEHYCENVVTLVEDCVRRVMAGADRARERDPEVLGGIMEGLVLTGVAMSLYGNSRPASGCEHHMSHYWEMMFEQQGRRPVPHGTQVGVSTVLILKLARALCDTPVDFDAARAAARAYSRPDWERKIAAAYGPAAAGVIALEDSAHKNDTPGRLERIDAIQTHWQEILGLLEALPAPETVMDTLRSLDSPCLPGEIGVEGTLLRNTFLYAKEVRARYTLLQMIWDLGLLEKLTDRVIASL